MSSSHATTPPRAHGSPTAYIVGFILSILLTLIPYFIVTHHAAGKSTTVAMVWILLFALVQLIVQLIFFLHLNTRPEQREKLSTFLFTLLIIAILACGALWIMYNLNINMMDSQALEEMKAAMSTMDI